MCREMKLPLKDLRVVLESQDDNHFIAFLEKQRSSAKKELERLQGVVEDISWLENQWRNKLNLQKDKGIIVKQIEERTVIPAICEDGFSNDRLHIKLQEIVKNEMKHRKSIKRHYGYFLDIASFLCDKTNTLAEYIELDTYEHTKDDLLEILPSGNYACFNAPVFSKEMDYNPLISYLEENHTVPKRVFASE